jgi:hypothetical protein
MMATAMTSPPEARGAALVTSFDEAPSQAGKRRRKAPAVVEPKTAPPVAPLKSITNIAAAQPALIPAAKSAPTEDELQQMQYNTDNFGGMYAECEDNDFLYRVCHVANDLLDSASILVRESGLTIQTTDPQSVAVVIIDMPASMFTKYRCEGFVVAHINMETIVNMLKKTGSDHAKFKLTLEIKPEDPEIMIILVTDKKKMITTQHTVKLWQPKDVVIYFDNAQFDRYCVVSSRAWHEEINNLSHLVDPNKPIRILAGNDLEITIEDDYGDSATKFQQNVTPGYKVVEKRVDVTEKDANGNYTFFDQIVGLSMPVETKGRKPLAAKQAARKRQVAAAAAAKKKPAARKRKPADDDDDDDEDEDEDEEEENSEEDGNKPAMTFIEDEAEDALLVDKPPPRLPVVKLTLSLLLLKMISKGLRLDPELFLLIKKNYPMMFVQKIRGAGRIWISLSPKALDDDDASADDAQPHPMDSIMAQSDE